MNRDEKKKKRCPGYPPWVNIKPTDKLLARFKKIHGGSIPDISGRKHKYPIKSNEKAWCKLYANALTYRNKSKYCLRKGYEQPNSKYKYKYEYLIYHGRPDQKDKRGIRNKDRKENGLVKGDKLVVHHWNQDNMTGIEIMTHCEHQRAHGRTCKKMAALQRSKKKNK